ncbi:hypothetical protein NE237_001362 [Protea cynaroides]|uniref:Wound-responsive family protein n=1 Tax=Protea cynaroides TaxID=273540 RepID=A0A9Q0KT67_9MAGN|nr:hypothetical protein NE237_001362 [Protea cynaroides]
MNSTGKAWIVAASIGAVEVLKDQGICRWNYILRSLYQHNKTKIRSFSQTTKVSSSPATSSMVKTAKKVGDEKLKQSEESFRTVMYLSNPSLSFEYYLILQIKIEEPKMSSTSRAWIVAASVGTVEALKDQGFCRWNYAMRLLHQQAKNNGGSIFQAKRLLPSSSSAVAIAKKVVLKDERLKQSEESLRKVMHLSCWGPN